MKTDNEAVRRMVKKHLHSGATILAAVSGGADSVCMLHVLNSLKNEYDFALCAAHVNHMIRGIEADGDEEYVRSLCKGMGVKCYIKKCDVPLFAKERNISLEEAGRAMRYDFFNELRLKHNIDYIATAHNKCDQAETVIMRVLRGTGIDGLRGIKRAREDGVIRPLLDVTRDEIENYCEAHNLHFKTDSTNSDIEYTRNKIRYELIPYLKRFNPSVIDALAKLADNIAEDADFIDGYAKRLYNSINSPLPAHKPTALHIESLNMLHNAMRTRMYISASRDAMGGSYKLERKHIEAVDRLSRMQSGGEINLPSGLTVYNRYGWLEFENMRKRSEDIESFCEPFDENGSVTIEKAGAVISSQVIDKNDFRPAPNLFAIDYLSIKGRGMVVRSRKMGDRMVVFKNGKSKKLKKYFIDMKISKEEREKIPLLAFKDSGDIIAILGHRVCEPYRMKKTSNKLLVVKYEKSAWQSGSSD